MMSANAIKKREFNPSLNEIISYFKPGVALSAKTLYKRTGVKNRYILGAVKRLIQGGRLRRVESSEVGSNKFLCLTEEQKKRICKDRNKKCEHKKKLPLSRRFHVFILT